MSTTYTNPVRRLVADRSSPGETPGARIAATVRPDPAPRRRRPDDDHRITRGVDLLEHPPDELVGIGAARSLERPQLVGGGERGVEVGAQHIRGFDEHDTAATATRRWNASNAASVSMRRPNGADGSRTSSSSPTAAVGHHAVVVHQRARPRSAGTRRCPASTIGCAPSPLATTARGTCAPVEGVPERAEGRVVDTVGVLAVERVDAEMDEPGVDREPGALAEHLPGRGVPVGLARLERLARERIHRRRPSAGAERRVAARRRVPAAGGAGDEVGDGGPREQRLEMGVVGGLDVGPRRRRQRHDEHPVDGRSSVPAPRARTSRCRRAARSRSRARRSCPRRPRLGATSQLDGEIGIDRLERGFAPRRTLRQHAQHRDVEAHADQADHREHGRGRPGARRGRSPAPLPTPPRRARPRSARRAPDRVREERLAEPAPQHDEQDRRARAGTRRCARGRAPPPWPARRRP